MEPKTAEEFQSELNRIAKESDADPTNEALIAEYEAVEAKALAFGKSKALQERHKVWNAPRVNIQPPSVIKGSRDDGRYAFDKYLRGDAGAASELMSYQGGPKASSDPRVQEWKTVAWPTFNSGAGRYQTPEEYAQTETTTGGGYLVPTLSPKVLVKVTKAFGGIANVAAHINTGNGDPLNFPTIDDTANSSALAAINAAPASGGADLVFGTVTLGAFKYAATGTGQLGLKVPRELIDDALFDVTGLVTELLGVRLARKMASEYAVGVGTTAPSGLFNATSTTTAAWVLSTGLVQATANQQLQAFIHNLDPSYITENCCWIMNWATHGVISGFVDSTNRPLMVSYSDSGLSEPMSFRLLGYPVKIDQASPVFSLTASANPANVNTAYAAFGDIEQGYLIRDVQGIGIAVDPFTGIGSNQVLYFGYARTDAKARNTAAFELLPGYHA